jgi:hypothetical protein
MMKNPTRSVTHSNNCFGTGKSEIAVRSFHVKWRSNFYLIVAKISENLTNGDLRRKI